ncbi:disease resistance protein Pik-2-like [Phragmites australis]|uniref:disease resistance protein Pik-2-like n=1 Tax=Phragmites australis TaxID=29695 RepID=UPI002D799827|nr:disease resistance protein Pik-2-like [Phragmites australis]XP_062197511.1 disease resistance protein Pik-2-like [Phragmites australis]XP_062197512.1 disease resistance protein Pik-2-like [Phragmites australis]
MQVVTGAMGTLLPKLANLLTEEYKLQKNIRGEIMFLKAELESMEAALLKISKAPIDHPPDIQVKLWAREVRELSYDIEDSVDTFMVCVDTHMPTEAKPLSFRGFFEKTINLLTRAKIRHNIGTDIRNIKTRIKEVGERRDRYKVDIIDIKPLGPTIDSLRLSALYKRATELVGTGPTSLELVKRLLDEHEASTHKQLKIVSIVGFGGLGKTTLAKIVYEMLKGQFDRGAFVSVSLNPNMINIFSNMLHQLGNSNYEATWKEEQFIDELRKFLWDKRYFIVIDDIWNISVWEQIHYALIENERGSRIITTTRKLDVARQIGGVYQLKPLSLDDSRKLFYLRIFGVEDKCPPNELARVSENILRKCGGVPLAIITIASVLARQKGKENTHNYWSKVYQSMGSGLEDSSDVNDMRRILSISYYELPPHLKACLLYLSLYPEDYKISTEALIWKWAGEGFVRKEQGKAMYEVGEDYLEELVNRSMIQPEAIDSDETVTSFRVHDMVLDLITCLSNEDNFLTTLDGQRSIYLPNKIHRLSLQTSNEDDVKRLSTVSLSYVRSLTVSAKAFDLSPSLSSFPILRALDLSGCKQVVNQHFRDICNAFHLRYLGLHSTSITKIPKEIENLQFLQILDVSWTGIKELPSTFVQLQQLMYLCVDYQVRIPNGFGNLKYMQEMIGYIDVESPTMLHDLDGLIELRSINLRFDKWDKSYGKHVTRLLSNMVSLKHIELYGCNGDLDSQCDRLSPGPQQLQNIQLVCGIIHAVPRWMSSLSALSSLSIALQTLGEEDLQLLGSMPYLSSLSVKVAEQTQDREKKLAIGNVHPFRCLKMFCIRQTIEVAFAPGAMQNLITFHLAFELRQIMDQFGDPNFGLENLSSLVDVSVEMNCSKAMIGEVIYAEAAIKKAVNLNPKKPTLNLVKLLVDWTR